MSIAIDGSTSATTGQSASAKQLAGNFDTFLKLLTTQLQNQDPLSPMDSNQFTQQLVQFSSVEQQISTNDNLKQLIGLGQVQTNNLGMSYLGKNVVLTNGAGALADGKATWTYGLDGAAAATTLTVTDAKGKVVYTAAGDNKVGSHTFEWDGKDAGGNTLPPGGYQLTVNAKAADGTKVTTSVASKGQVSAIDMSSGTPQLVIGSMIVPLSYATLIGTN
jgi:flagellar basal-body rod modification protein FlgD